MTLTKGIRVNLVQFLHQLLQVLLVGLTLGMTRTVIPALAESDFEVPKNSFMLLATFVVAFGLVKGAMNFVAGRLSETLGRKRVLLIGWIVAIPVPFMIWYSPDWVWIVGATVLLGVNQGMTWSMTQTSKLDLTLMEERGLTIGLNEFAGYAGVALGGIVTAYLAGLVGSRDGLLVFGCVVIGSALVLTLVWVRDTLPWTHEEIHRADLPMAAGARYPANVSARPGTLEIFALLSWRDARMFALCQAGLVEKFVDALVWIMYPVFLVGQGLSLTMASWVIAAYGLTWGCAQLVTGRLSDRIGRHLPNVAGMWLCGAGVAMMVAGEGLAWWTLSAALSGLGMALLYPNLSASIADISHPAWRGSAIGIYRFWRDLGYAIGATGIGLAAQLSGRMQLAFWLVAAAMGVSGALLLWLSEETHPRLNPAPI